MLDIVSVGTDTDDGPFRSKQVDTRPSDGRSAKRRMDDIEASETNGGSL